MRAGSVLLHNELGVQQANVGDVITLGSNAMFGYEPEGFVTVTTICLDLDYVIDQVFWQHAAKFTDRLGVRSKSWIFKKISPDTLLFLVRG